MYSKQPRVAVIGAGISGLACASRLAEQNCQVSVFEKSRGAGGRMSTRRVNEELSFDHGAQYFSVSDPTFKRHVESWIQDQIVHPWHGNLAVYEQGQFRSCEAAKDRYVASPGMNAIAKYLAKHLDVTFNTKVVPPTRTNDQWRLTDEDGNLLGDFDYVVVSIPAGQAIEMLTIAPKLSNQAEAISMSECWALMLAFKAQLNFSFDGAKVSGSPVAWIARNSSKPQRRPGAETWVIHATPEWSSAHLEDSNESVTAVLREEFFSLVGSAPEVVHETAHRWRFSLPEETTADDCLFDQQLRLGACGDWCGGPRVEGAFLSGLAMANQIIANAIA